MAQEKKSALVLGANGLIGELVVDALLKNDGYNIVYAVSRKGIEKENNKLIQIYADFNNIEEKIKDIKVDHFFSCIGSTKAKSPNMEDYYNIDLHYPIFVAKTLHKNGNETVCLVSSIGADPASTNFYLKLKGKVEQNMVALGLVNTYIFRPSILMGKRKEKRTMEALIQKISPLLDFFLVGSLKKYKSIEASTVAKAMIKAALSDKRGLHIYNTEEIKKIT